MKLHRALFLPLCLLALQGCVLAAAAVPLAAGGVIGARAVLGERTAQAIAEGNDIDPDAILAASFGQYALVPGGVLPEPTMPLPSEGPYGDLRTFTTTAIAQDTPGFSALLADPTSVQPTRAPCEADVPAVLIDLDPADDVMPLESASPPSDMLVNVVESFRRENIAIAWITDREPTDAARIRERLLETRLDPTGRDPLFVQRYPGELKQARRQALLETHCLIAIAGDDRRDFDDLFIYLIDPTDADALDPMIGNGWFLIPTPLD